MTSEAHARHNDPSTAHEAAERVAATRLEAEVFDFLRGCRAWLTVIEIAEAMDIDKWSVSPRLRPLHRKGLVEVDKALRINSNGNIAPLQVWRAKQAQAASAVFVALRNRRRRRRRRARLAMMGENQ